MFRDTALNPYFFKKVIKKPKPMKIMTWTSWNTLGKVGLFSPEALSLFIAFELPGMEEAWFGKILCKRTLWIITLSLLLLQY